ncbi:MAG: hypothetical protein H7840_00180 [Alphaproteobacteria bacterium]
MVGILDATGFTASNSLKTLVMSKMQESYAKQLDDSSDTTAAEGQARYNRILDDVQVVQSNKSRLSLAAMFVADNLKNITAIKDALFDMKVCVEKAAEAGADTSYWAERFDKGLRTVNSKADALPRNTNLLGNCGQTVWNEPSMAYQTDAYGSTTTIQGKYIGSDMYIDDSNGKKWVPDWGSLTIQQYDTYSNTGNSSANVKTSTDSPSFTNGLRLDSFTEATGAITFTTYPEGGASSQSVTGTVTRGGLDVMPAWMYGGLTTTLDATAMTRATADINTARSQVEAFEATLKAVHSGIKGKEGTLAASVEAMNDEGMNVLRDTYTASAIRRQDVQARYQGMVMTLQSMMDSQNSYASLFAGAGVDKMTGLLYDGYF